MRKTAFVAAVLLSVTGCTEPTSSSPGPAAPSQSRVSSPMQGVRADGELVPFPEVQDVPELAVGSLQDHYAERLTDQALVEAVRRTGGRVTIGLKPVGRGHTRTTGRIPAMSRAEVLLARENIRERAIQLVRTFRSISDVVAEIDPEQAPAIRRLAFVNYLEPDESGEPAAQQDTSWGLKKIGAHTVWASSGSRGEYASITMIDTGIDSTHFLNTGLDGPANVANCLYVSGNATSCFQHQDHGAAVAGVLSARDNSFGYIGVAPEPYFFTSMNVCGQTSCLWGDLAAALDWAKNSGYARHVVNLSFQYCDGNSTFASSLAQAVSAGLLVVASVGNTDFSCSSGSGAGTAGVAYPAKYSQVVAVSGTMEDDSFATGSALCPAGSRSGPEVDISAPFWHPSMRAFGATYYALCGTSLSAPTLAAAAAILWSAHPTWTAANVINRMTLTAVDLGSSGKDNQFGYGRLALDDAFTVPTLTASIGGNAYINEGNQNSFTAFPSGGVPPYVTYTWRINGNVEQTGSSSFNWTAYSSYTVSVTVTDNASTTSSQTSMGVTVIPCPPPQITCE